MSLAALKINGATSSLNGVLAACVAIMNAGKSAVAWWVCLGIVVAISIISLTRAGMALWLRIRDWRRKRLLTQWQL